MKKLLLTGLIGLVMCVGAMAQSVTSTNVASWNPVVSTLYSNITYNVVAANTNVPVAQLGTATALPSLGNGVLGAVNANTTNTTVSAVLPIGTTPSGTYNLWLETVGTSAGVASASSWIALTFTYVAPALPAPTGLKIQ